MQDILTCSLADTVYNLRMNTEFKRYLIAIGGDDEARRHLECDRDLIAKMKRGDRAISKRTGKIIVDRFPQLSLYHLLYPQDGAA